MRVQQCRGGEDVGDVRETVSERQMVEKSMPMSVNSPGIARCLRHQSCVCSKRCSALWSDGYLCGFCGMMVVHLCAVLGKGTDLVRTKV